MIQASNEAEVIKIGEDRELTIRLLKEDGDSFSLSGLTAAEVRFAPASGTTPVKKTLGAGLSVVSADAGKMLITLGDADTALLKEGAKQTFTVVLDFGTTRRIIDFKKAITVEAPSVSA